MTVEVVLLAPILSVMQKAEFSRMSEEHGKLKMKRGNVTVEIFDSCACEDHYAWPTEFRHSLLIK